MHPLRGPVNGSRGGRCRPDRRPHRDAEGADVPSDGAGVLRRKEGHHGLCHLRLRLRLDAGRLGTRPMPFLRQHFLGPDRTGVNRAPVVETGAENARRGGRPDGQCGPQTLRFRGQTSPSPPSSRGLGHGLFKSATRVRIPLGGPTKGKHSPSSHLEYILWKY